VAVVPGSERNIKITYPGDLSIAEVLLSAGDSGTSDSGTSDGGTSDGGTGAADQ
jgi:uncharacterized membrane protein YgcG